MSGTILVVDRKDGLHQALAKSAPRLRHRMVACHQMAKASREVAAGDVAVLVAGPSCLTQTGIRFLQKAHEEHPDLITLLVTEKDSPEIETRDLVRIGASDMVRYPAAAKTLRGALERALDMADVAASHTRSAEPGGTVFTVTSPTGGCGKTFFATNLAYELAAHSGKRVALIDLDLQFGEVNAALHLRPEYTISDLLEQDEGVEALRAQLPEFMEHHPSGVEVLAAPGDPAEADFVSSPDVTRILQVAKELYHYVIVDTPAALTEEVLAAFDLSERLIVMATLDMPSIKNLGVFLSTLDRLKIPSDGVSLVLNKAESDVGLSPAEVQRLFDSEFRGILPYAKEVSRSFNTGRPILDGARSANIGRELLRAIHNILPEEVNLEPVPATVDGAAIERVGFFDRLFGRLARA